MSALSARKLGAGRYLAFSKQDSDAFTTIDWAFVGRRRSASGLAVLQSFDPALLITAVPVIERRSRDPDRRQRATDQERPIVPQFDDLELLGCGYLMKRPPSPENAFFEQAVFDQDLSQCLLELARLA